MLESQKAIIVALTKGFGTCLFVSDDSEMPPGCGTEIISADITIHIPVRGKVDAAAEIEKLQKKETLAQGNKGKLLKLTGQVNYESNVKQEVRAINEERVSRIFRR